MSAEPLAPLLDATAYREPKPTRRGTSNGNDRGSAETRRKRRAWLIETYRADTSVRVRFGEVVPCESDHPDGVPACRCYRCGTLLSVDTVTVDRIIPGAEGGTYHRNNIRPACGTCNSSTGGALGNSRRKR